MCHGVRLCHRVMVSDFVSWCHGVVSDFVMVWCQTLSWCGVRLCHGVVSDFVMVWCQTLSWCGVRLCSGFDTARKNQEQSLTPSLHVIF